MMVHKAARTVQNSLFYSDSITSSHLNVWRGLRAMTCIALTGVSAVALACVSTNAMAQTLPTGGSVTAGSATITAPNASTLNINQSSNQAIINWQSFSVGAGGTVNFNQPGASSATLNRVTGLTPSSIAGTINAPGTVLLVNPNGIAITKSGVVNAGSFAASTLDIKNEDFLAGRYKFGGNGSSATVTNAGRINVSDGGFAALLGGRVANDGVITARLGKVGLGSGEMITLDMSGDGFLSVAVPSSQLGNLKDGTGKALVTNSGKIRADGGTVFLSAATATNLLRDAVNVPGSIRANSVGTHNGRIVIGGGSGGRVSVTGRLAANGSTKSSGGNIAISGASVATSGKITANGATGGGISIASSGNVDLAGTIAAKGNAWQGGSITITGSDVAAVSALIDASGTTGGGTIQIGGGPQGSGPLAHAQSLSIDSSTVISADALDNGQGGTIIAWSDGLTSAKGTLSARGGVNGGDGGFIETSGHSVDFTGITIGVSAPNGSGGKWLIDPNNITIDAAAASTLRAALAGGAYVVLQTNADGTTSSSTGAGTTSVGNGDININAAITGWSSGGTLALTAANDINVNAALGSGAGALVAQAGGSFIVSAGGSLNLTTASITAKNNISLAGTVSLTGTSSFTANNTFGVYTGANLGTNPTVNAGFVDAQATLTMSGGGTFNSRGDMYFQHIANNNGGLLTLNADSDGTGAGSVFFSNTTISTSGHVDIFYHPANYSDPSYYPSIDGGGSITAWKLVSTPEQFAALNNLSGAQNQFYALNHDIDYSNSKSLVGGPIKVNINTQTIQDFYGTLNGFGHAILNPYVSLLDSTPGWTGSSLAALIGTNHGTIKNFGVVGGTFAGNYVDAAGLVVTNAGTLSGVFSSANVSTSGRAGGLVAVNANDGTINGGSYASGAVNGGSYAGGLVADNYGIITDSYATGAVGQLNQAQIGGGLVGVNEASGQITYTYALGAVNAVSYSGGLVGKNAWSSSDAGRNGCYSCGGRGGGYIADSYAAGAVSSSNGYVGGLVGWLAWDTNSDAFAHNYNSSATLYWSIWDSIITHQAIAIGYSYRGTNTNKGADFGVGAAISGKPTLNDDYVNFLSDVSTNSYGAYQLLSYQYFNNPNTLSNSDSAKFNDHWYIIQGQSRPFLRAEYSTTIGNTHQLQLIDMNGTASYTLMRNIDATPPAGSTSMWSSGNFAAIAPVSWSDVLTNLQNLDFTTTDLNGVVTYHYSDLGTVNISTAAPATSFTGTFDGQGHTISNLNVSVPLGGFGSISRNVQTFNGRDTVVTSPAAYYTPSAALFDVVGTGGTVESVGILKGSFNNAGSYSPFGSSYGNAGAIAGSNYGNLVWAYADANTSIQSAYIAGGLVGINYGGSGGVFQSYSRASVTSSGDGQSASSIAGGVVGDNEGLVKETYSTGTVSGNGKVGGLVGYNSGYIVDSYAAGAVNKANANANISYGGHLVGQNTGTVLGSFYDTDSALAGNILSLGTAGTGYARSVLQDLNSYSTIYAGWNFSTVWAPPNQAGQGGLSTAYYPELYAVSPVIFVQGQNTTRTYGSANPTVSASYTGGSTQYQLGLDSDGLIFAPSATSSATQSSGVGTYSNTPTNGNSLTSTSGVTYRVVTKAGSLVVTPRPVTVTADAITTTYGTTPTLTYQVTSGSVVNGDLFSGALAGSGNVNVGTSAITRGTLALSSNYTLSFVGNTLQITPATLTVTPDAGQSKVYGASDPGAYGYAVSGFQYTDGTSVLSGALSRSAGQDVGSYSYTLGSLAANSNYTLSFASNPAKFAITPTTLFVTPTGLSKVYGETDPVFTYSAEGYQFGQNGSVFSGALSRASGQNVGSYGYTLGTLSAGSNYTLSFVANPASFAITARDITLSALSQTKMYGELDPTLTYSVGGLGLAAGDTQAAVFTGALTRAAGENVVAGGYGITQGSLQANSNYNVTGFTQSTLTITPRTITVTADAQTKVYGNADPLLTYTVGGNGLGNGDTQATVFTGALTRAAGENVVAGGYAITRNTLAANANYSVTGFAGAKLAITPRQITVTADAQSKVYGEVDPTLTYTVGGSGLGNGDTQAMAFTGSLVRAVGENVVAGGYGITQNTLTANANYSVTSFTGAKFTITPRQITVTADAQSKVYGEADQTLTYTVGGSGLGNGDTQAAAFTGSLVRAAGENVVAGGYGITQNTLAANGNYSVTSFTGANLMITPRQITVTADAQTKVYGDADPVLTYRVGGSGFGNGDTQTTVFTGSLSRAAGENAVTAGYDITQNTLAANANYAITGFKPSVLSIIPAPITVTANGGSSVYGQSPTNPGLSATGLKFKDGVDVLTDLSNSFGILPTSGVAGSPYTLSVLGTLSNPNYSITTRNTGTWVVTPAPIEVTALGGTSVYGSAPANPGLAATNLQNGEGVDVLTGLSNSFGILKTSNVAGSPYVLTVDGKLSNPNYTINATHAGSWIVTPALISVAADPQSRQVGQADPALTYKITSGQLFNGDTFHGALTRAAGEQLGIYAITQGSFGATTNYALTFFGADFTIKSPPTNPSSNVAPPVNGGSPPTGGTQPPGGQISFAPPPTTPISFTAGGGGAGTGGSGTGGTGGAGGRAANAPTDTTVAAVKPNDPLDPVTGATDSLDPKGERTNGLNFLPISQYDAKQYSGGKLPGYEDRDGEATIFTMIARAIANKNPTGVFIDGFWNADTADKQGASQPGSIQPRVTFSDGAGKSAVPPDGTVFPLVKGTTDLGSLLGKGPLMLQGAAKSGAAGSWMLAIRLTDDGKGIIANDPVTGRQIILAYDAATKTVGGATSIFNPVSKAWVPIAEANAVQVAGEAELPADRFTALQNFVPQGYLALSIN